MFYIFDGDDAFSQQQELDALLDKAGDPALAELNTTRLDGRTVDLGELYRHCGTPPFLSDRRIVIVTGLLERLGHKAKGSPEARDLADLTDYLPGMPETTRLFFVEAKPLPARHPIVTLARQGDSGHIKTFALPEGGELVRWAIQRTRQVGAQIEPAAARALCDLIGPDLYQLDREIAKLAAYAGDERAIAESDVTLLTPHARTASIFDLVDALGRRDGKTASDIYHVLLDANEHPLAILGMITRQFRLMIQAQELAPTLVRPEAIARELGQKTYPIRKILAQSRNFSPAQLRHVYHRLLETDVDIKTGRMEPTLALDTLIAALSQRA